MAKDYKTYIHAKKSSSKSAKPKKNFKILALVILLSVLIALGLLVFFHKNSLKKGLENSKLNASSELNNKSTKINKAKVDNLEKTEKPKPKLKFEFYTILPKEKVELPSPSDFKKAPVVSADAGASLKSPLETVIPSNASSYILQVASTRNEMDADALRAKLMMEGYPVFIQKNKVNGVLWYRVQIGNFNTKAEAILIQNKLKEENIVSLLKAV